MKLRYRYDEDTTTHVVEVTPKVAYTSSDFTSLEIETWKKFFARFPDEGLCFITDDGTVGIDDVEGEEYAIQGVSYAESVSMPQKTTTFYRQEHKRATAAI
ncbi:MAG: hypothetical protein LBJ57_00880 [Prevotellaceae bacterium]|nr:hypothetical protein [Prevotellaceae bacterium]